MFFRLCLTFTTEKSPNFVAQFQLSEVRTSKISSNDFLQTLYERSLLKDFLYITVIYNRKCYNSKFGRTISGFGSRFFNKKRLKRFSSILTCKNLFKCFFECISLSLLKNLMKSKFGSLMLDLESACIEKTVIKIV